MDEKSPGLVPPDWRSRLDTSLAELDTQVWVGGMESLSNANVKSRAPREVHRAPKSETPDDTATDEEQEQPKAPPQKKKKVDDDEDE
jgi:hypothetical protein